MSGRRRFLKDCTMLAGAAGMMTVTPGTGNFSGLSFKKGKGVLKLSFRPYELQLKHVFTLSTSSRSTTPVMLTEIEYDGMTGYGEASMPPYLGESHATATEFLSKVNLSQFSDPFLMEDILNYVEGIAPGNYAAKASVDIALHDLTGKFIGQPWHRIWGLNREKTPNTSFTIGIDKPDVVRTKVQEAAPYRILKVKLGQGNEKDREMIETIRQVTDKPICVDANQGWTDRVQALEMIHWLKERGVVFIEQPMPKNDFENNGWITANSPLPVFADEAFQTMNDFFRIRDSYNGINVKLMKCGGLRPAFTIIKMAKTLGMKVMIGCMTETSCAVTAASQLSPLADFADLDGNLLISNDLFSGMEIVEGKIKLPDTPGVGIKKL